MHFTFKLFPSTQSSNKRVCIIATHIRSLSHQAHSLCPLGHYLESAWGQCKSLASAWEHCKRTLKHICTSLEGSRTGEELTSSDQYTNFLCLLLIYMFGEQCMTTQKCSSRKYSLPAKTKTAYKCWHYWHFKAPTLCKQRLNACEESLD